MLHVSKVEDSPVKTTVTIEVPTASCGDKLCNPINNGTIIIPPPSPTRLPTVPAISPMKSNMMYSKIANSSK